MQAYAKSDLVAMLDLLTAARRLGQSTKTTCVAMLLALEHVGGAMQEEERLDLARSTYVVADGLAAPQTEDAP